MKKILNRLLVTVMILSLCMSGVVVAFAADSAADSGISVQYNGENIVFTDAVPKIVNSRTVVPFRQILETMGAQVTYDEPTKTVVAVKDDMQFSFVIGGNDITIVQGDDTTVKKMDVAPFIDPATRRTYVPARFMAESMNYSVTWDQYEKTAIIIDPAALFANADEDFSIVSKLLTTDTDPEKTYKTTGSFLIDMSSYQVSGLDSLDFKMSGDISGIQHKTKADMVINLMVSFDNFLSKMSAEEKDQMKPIFDMMKNSKMKFKMNGESGDMYMNSPLFALMDSSIDSNTWLKMNIFETYDQLGIDLRPLMDYDNQSKQSLSQLLQMAILSMNTGDVESYNNMKIAYTFIKNLIGNEAFKTSSSGSITTHSLQLDKNKIIEAVTKTSLEAGLKIDAADVAYFKEKINEISLKTDIIIKEKDGKLYNYNMGGNFSFDELKMSFNMAGDTFSSKIEMDFDYPSMAKMTIKADSKYTETSEPVDLTLPADAKVLDYNTYLMMPAL